MVATDKPRFTITLNPELLQSVEQFKDTHGYKTQSGAIQALIAQGIEAQRAAGGLPPDKPISQAEQTLLKTYGALDTPGKRAVQVTLADQTQRVKEARKAARSQAFEADQETARVIPLYYTPAAAGLASPSFAEDFEYIPVGGEVPTHAEFAVRIDGDSMEPYLRDGSIAYVNRDPMSNGDVGIFFCDGDFLCKQYAKDAEGNITLFSLNRDREDADRFLSATSNRAFTCLGRVILPHPVNLPKDF